MPRMYVYFVLDRKWGHKHTDTTFVVTPDT